MRLKLDEIIANIAKTEKVSFLEAVITYCDERKMDPTQIAKKLSADLIEKISEDAKNLHLLKR